MDKNVNAVRCGYCLAKITAENKDLPRIDYRETTILNQEQHIKNLEAEVESLKQQLAESKSKL